MDTKPPIPTTRIITLLSFFISLSLAQFVSPSDVNAQVAPGTWLSFEFTPANTKVHVRTDSVLKRISDSLRIIRDELDVLPGLHGNGLVDRLAYWVDDSTLSLWLSVSEVATAMDAARGMRDSSWLGLYNLPNDEWGAPGYIDEPPYPAWYTRDWRKWEKYGLYTNTVDGPLRIYAHPRGDSAMVFEVRLPRAVLLDYIGLDSTQATVPHIAGYYNQDAATSIADSGATQILASDGAVLISHQRTIAGDTLVLFISLNWERLHDSVLVWAGGGGGGSSTFTGLTDTPASYSGQAGKVVKVNPGETALIFADDNVGVGSSSASLVYDTSNVVVGDSAYYWEGRWMKPRLSRILDPSYMVYAGDSAFVKTANGWKEFEVHFVRGNGTNAPIYLDFVIRADSANGRFLRAVKIYGDVLEASSTTLASDFMIHAHMSGSARYTATRSGTIRSGASNPSPSISSFTAPGASEGADGHVGAYYMNVRLYSARNFSAYWPMTIRIYYGRRLNTPEDASDWDVKLEDL